MLHDRFAAADGEALKRQRSTMQNGTKMRFLPTVGKRGAAIVEARGLSSAVSAANAAYRPHAVIGRWVQTANG